MDFEARATEVEIVGSDETGAILNIRFCCPNCGYETGDLISIGPDSVEKMHSPFSVDMMCWTCCENVRVVSDAVL